MEAVSGGGAVAKAIHFEVQAPNVIYIDATLLPLEIAHDQNHDESGPNLQAHRIGRGADKNFNLELRL